MLADLTERERQALTLRFVENKTQSEIAEVLGISQVHVSRLLAKTLRIEPALFIEKDEIDEVLNRLDDTLRSLA